MDFRDGPRVASIIHKKLKRLKKNHLSPIGHCARVRERLHVSLTNPNTARRVTLLFTRTLSAMQVSCALYSTQQPIAPPVLLEYMTIPYPGTRLRHLEPLPVRTQLPLVRQAERIELMRAQVDPARMFHQREHVPVGSRYGTASLPQLSPMPDSSVVLNVSRSCDTHRASRT